MKKKFAIVLLSLFLVVSLPFAAHANIVTATGKYLINAIKHVPGAAKVTATNTATGAKHVVTHGVSASDLGKGIGAGVVTFAVGSGVGFAFKAITGLALDAVDWVMDKENNSIKWKKKGEGASNPDGSVTPVGKGWEVLNGSRPVFSNPTAAAKDFCASNNKSLDYVRRSSDTSYNFECPGLTGTVRLVDKPPSDGGSSNDPYKSIPLDTLAQKTIEQADGGEVLSQQAIEDYVTNLAREGKLDAELDAATDITPPEGTEPDDPTKPDDKECPLGSVLVDDVCVVKSDSDDALWCNSTDFSKKICDWIDWTQEKPDDLKSNDGKIDVIDKSDDLEIDEDRIVFDDQCPPPTPIELVVMGFPYSEELDYQPFCDFFGMLNPFVVGMGGISSALIIAGGIRRG